MKNLPVCVSDHDIEEMFAFADKDRDGQLSYAEFQVCYIIYLFVTNIFVATHLCRL